MKIFKLKYIVMLISASLLWSCQTEETFTKAATISKKVPLPDGIPSAADDQYEFAKSTYYHGDTVITDTLLIKQMLATANGLHLDETGYKKQIFVTKQEREAFDAATENNPNRATAAPDGDNYVHYFYEFNTRSYQSSNFVTLRYFSRVGPHEYYATYNYNVHAYKDLDTSASPELTGGYNLSTTLTNYYNINAYDISFQINVINTTRYKRRVRFKSQSDQIISVDVNSKGSFTLNGGVTVSDYYYLNGMNFNIRQAYSYNI